MNTNRRDFLKLTAAAAAFSGVRGALAAVKDLLVSPIRGGGADSVLKLTPLELCVGAAKPFKALHVSDTHFNFWDITDYCGSERRNDHFERRWVRFPQALNSFYATIDYAAEKRLPILHTGDLIDWNSCGNRRVLAHNLKGLDFFYALGNHEYHTAVRGEDSTMTNADARALLQKIMPNDLTVASRVVNGVNFVAFDDGEVNLRDETVRGVKAEFGKGLPVVLLCHIPPFYTREFLENKLAAICADKRRLGVAEEDLPTQLSSPIQDSHDERTRAFYDWLRGQRQLKAILCGHTHIEERGAFSETADMIVAGGNFEGCGYEIEFL